MGSVLLTQLLGRGVPVTSVSLILAVLLNQTSVADVVKVVDEAFRGSRPKLLCSVRRIWRSWAIASPLGA